MTASSPIAVVGGTGHEGRGIALRFARAGIPVVVGSRDRARAEQVAGAMSDGGRLPVTGSSNAEAVARCDVVILAVPFAHAVESLRGCAEAFRPGALLVDVTLPIAFVGKAPVFTDLPEGSAAEHLRHHLPPQARLVATFKTISAATLVDVERSLDCDEFVCGDAEDARRQAMDLLRALPGLRPIDAGPLEAARALERMTLLAIAINRRYKFYHARFRVIGLEGKAT